MAKRNTVCRYYQQGSCYKGSKCDFLHPGSGQSNDRSNPESELEDIAYIINLQLAGAETPEYQYSSFSPHNKSQNNLIANRDYSPEEYRWDYMHAMRTNALPQFQSRMAERDADRKRIVDYVLSDRRKAARFSQLTLDRKADKAYEPPAVSSGSFGTSSSGAFGSNSNNNSNAFGQHGFGSGSNTSSAFGSNSGSSTFGSFVNKSSTGSAFGTASNDSSSSTASPFGSGQSSFGGKPAFGQSAFGSSSLTGSAFGSGGNSAPAFGQSAFASGTSTGTSSTPGFGQSAFGTSASTTTPSFGQTSSAATATGSAFGQSAFGQSSFGKSAFGSLNNSTNSTGAGSGTAFGKSAFGSPTTTPAFGQSPFGAAASINNATATETTTATGGTTKSAFGGFGTSSGAGGFGQSAFGQSAFGQATANNINTNSSTNNSTGDPTAGSAFSSFGNLESAAGTNAANSPFGKVAASGSPFSQTSAFGSTSFGQTSNPTKPESSGGFGAFSGNSAFGSSAAVASAISVSVRQLDQGGPGEELPKLADLHQLVREAFDAAEFELGKVPDTVPPLEVR